MQTNPDEEVFFNEFRRAVAANYVTFHVLYVAFCLHTTVQHVRTCVHKTGTFFNLLILLFHDRNIQLNVPRVRQRLPL